MRPTSQFLIAIFMQRAEYFLSKALVYKLRGCWAAKSCAKLTGLNGAMLFALKDTWRNEISCSYENKKSRRGMIYVDILSNLTIETAIKSYDINMLSLGNKIKIITCISWICNLKNITLITTILKELEFLRPYSKWFEHLRYNNV